MSHSASGPEKKLPLKSCYLLLHFLMKFILPFYAISNSNSLLIFLPFPILITFPPFICLFNSLHASCRYNTQLSRTLVSLRNPRVESVDPSPGVLRRWQGL